MRSHLENWLEYMKNRGYSERTLISHRHYLRAFLGFCRDHMRKNKVTEITKVQIERYRDFLFHRRDRKGNKLSVTTQICHLSAIRSFFNFLLRTNHILVNPGREVELPQEEKKIRRRALKAEEIERLFGAVDCSSPLGYRDRVIMEVIFSTGIRVSELIDLKTDDVRFDDDLLFVLSGKGGKDRYVPLCGSTKEYLKDYLFKARPLILNEKKDCGYLFLNELGTRIMSRSTVELMFHNYRARAGIKDVIGPHHLRVTCATAMLRGGASERYVQELLGHARLETTERYLEVLTDEMKNEHNRFHPRET